MGVMQFTRKEYPTIMDGLVVRWEGQVNWPNAPEVNASRNGVSICGGWPTMKAESLAEVRRVLDEAERTYERLSGGP